MSMWESRLPASAFYQVINIPGPRVKSKFSQPPGLGSAPPPAICLLISSECALSSRLLCTFCRQHQSRFSDGKIISLIVPRCHPHVYANCRKISHTQFLTSAKKYTSKHKSLHACIFIFHTAYNLVCKNLLNIL